MNYLTEEQVEKQEHLTKQRLALLKPSYPHSNLRDRPDANLIDLMHWVRCTFSKELGGSHEKLHPWIHNKIVIDGAFLEFAEQHKVKVECLYRDSVASWKSDKKYEHFMAQGVFKITYKKLSFIHAALFHKGNQNEDEVSFFVIMDDDNFEDYTKFRNMFDEWLIARDREHLEIHVVGGDGQPYSRDMEWKDLYLPENLKKDVKGSIEGFLNAKELYTKKKIPWKRGMLLYGAPGCHAKGTEILMYDGSVKNVEDVVVGDLLMGPDSRPREVLKLVRGREEMFNVEHKGGAFVVNKNHILHLKTNVNGLNSINISVNDFVNASVCLRDRSKLRYSDCVEFGNQKKKFNIDPYLLGVWLGDGTSKEPAVTTMDPEIADTLQKEAKRRSLQLQEYKKTNAKCITYRFSSGSKMKNSLRDHINELELFGNKHIPSHYLTASATNRLSLLAGLIDTDGGLVEVIWRASEKYKKTSGSHFEIIQKSERLSNDIVFLARSLGFRVTISSTTKTIKSTGFSGNYFRISIAGDISRIPVKLPRKKSIAGRPNKDKLRAGISRITSVGVDNYYGFTLDEDHLYLDGNFITHHNCGKTTTIRTIISNYDFKPVTVHTSTQTNDDTITEAFEYAQEQSPGLLYFEDLDTLLSTTVSISHFLNLLDGVYTRNGILVIATANDLRRLKESVTDRPSRFDRKWEVPVPDKKMALMYLKSWFGKYLKAQDYNSMVKHAVENNFSYAYLKELYLTSAYHAIAAGRENPNSKDVEAALEQLLYDKENALSGFVSENHEDIGYQ